MLGLIYGLVVLTSIMQIPFLLTPGLAWQNYLLVTLLFGIAVYFLNQLKDQKNQNHLPIRLHHWCVLAVTVFIPSYVAYLHIHDYSIWLDEYAETRNILKFDILSAATFYQQPPLGYYWRKWGYLLLGQNELGARSASLIANSLFLTTMFFNFKKITKDLVTSCIATLILGFNYWIITYAIEARSYQISLFYFSVYIYFLIEYFQNTNESKHARGGIKLGIITTLWLLSISMQPLFFVSLVTVFIGGYYFKSRTRKLKVLLFSQLGALLMFLPFLKKIIDNSQRYVTTSDVNSKSISSLWWDLRYLARDLFFQNTYDAIMLVIVGLALALSFKFSKNRKRIAIIFIFLLSYFFIIQIVFFIKINWHFSARYLITIIPAFGLAVIYALTELPPKFKFFRYAVITLGLALTILNFISGEHIKRYAEDWRGLYEKLNEDAPLGTPGFFIHLHQPNSWSGEYFVAYEFYQQNQLSIPKMDDYDFPVKITNDFLLAAFNGPQ
ncbi:MAG: hypothetical protein H7061_10420, partial [Bdellovibrionaceae bacterium]|nr:hypothetical protein [Bdellovibrio sp.]